MQAKSTAPTPNPVKQAAYQQQRSDLDPLLARAEIVTHAAFDQAKRDVMPLLQEFAVAYKAEYDRLNKDLDEDDEDEESKPVTHAWLISSGWYKRVTQALADAADTAGQKCLAAVSTGHKQAADLGAAHGRALVKAAMQPAVDAYVASGKMKPKRRKRVISRRHS